MGGRAGRVPGRRRRRIDHGDRHGRLPRRHSNGTPGGVRAGFEAGVHSIDPDIKVLAIYLAASGYSDAPDDAPDGARISASLLYDAGADVIFHAAGRSGVGVFEAAAGLSATNRWAIGIETDQWQAAGTRERPHVLTSIIKRFDVQIYTTSRSTSTAALLPECGGSPCRRMITYAPGVTPLSAAARASLDRTMQQLAAGRIRPPSDAIGALLSGNRSSSLVRVQVRSPGSDDVPVSFTLPAGWNVSECVNKPDSDPLISVSSGRRRNLRRSLPIGARRPARRSNR